MFCKLKPYHTYKEVGLPWLRTIPKHWELKRGKSFFNRIDQRSLTGKEELLTVSSTRGVVPRKTATVTMFKAESYKGYKLCWPNDLVINSLWAWAYGLGVSKYHGIISSAYGVYRIRPGATINPMFIHELVRSCLFQWELQVRSKGIWISRLQLTDESFLDAPFPIPPSDEQAAIIRFLDHVNGKIERAIRAKKKLIALLNEQKQTIIYRAVTRGLDPSVPLKPSNIPWLGEIPLSWPVKKLRHLSSLIVSNVDKHSRKGEQAVRLCNYTDVYKNEKIISSIEFMQATASVDEVAHFQIKIGDVIITKDSEEWDDIGVPSLVDCEAPDLLCGYHLAILRPSAEVLGEFLFRALQDKFIATQMHIKAKGVTRYGLSHNSIKDVLIPVPSKTEQIQICSFIANEVKTINLAIKKAEYEMTLLREYRTRLIADVVTGKLDVRQTAEKLPLENIEEVQEIIAEDALEEEVVDDAE